MDAPSFRSRPLHSQPSPQVTYQLAEPSAAWVELNSPVLPRNQVYGSVCLCITIICSPASLCSLCRTSLDSSPSPRCRGLRPIRSSSLGFETESLS